MQLVFTARHTLNSVFWSRNNHRLTHNIVLVLCGSLILILSAKIAIPLQPVNMTMQSLAALFLGMAFGWRLGCMSILLYLLEGALGLPVFSESQQGVMVLLGPAGGYLFGMVPAAMLSGYLVQIGWGRHNMTTALAALIGTATLYLFGLTYMTSLLGWRMAINFGLLPFLYVDGLKILFLTFLIPLMWQTKSE